MCVLREIYLGEKHPNEWSGVGLTLDMPEAPGPQQSSTNRRSIGQLVY